MNHRIPVLLSLLLFPLLSGTAFAQTFMRGEVTERSAREFVMPHNLVMVEFGGPARNAVLFSYQRIVPITQKSAFTARAGFFGFGNSREGGTEAQMDAAGAIGLLLSTQNQHNLELEAAFDRFLSREANYQNCDQNRYTFTAGYRLQPRYLGQGFGFRVGLGMLAYTETIETFYDPVPTIEESTGFYPTGYLGLGFAF